MKRLFTILLLLSALGAMSQNRTFDTITFYRGGMLYKLILWNDSMQINNKVYYSGKINTASGTSPLSLSITGNQLTGSMTQAGYQNSGYLSATDYTEFKSHQSPWRYGSSVVELVDNTIPIFSYVNESSNLYNSTFQQTKWSLSFSSTNSIKNSQTGFLYLNNLATASASMSVSSASKTDMIKLTANATSGGALLGTSGWNGTGKLDLGTAQNPWNNLYAIGGNSTEWNKAYSLSKLDSIKWAGINRCGFWDTDSVTVTFDGSTKVLTLSPTSPQTKFKYYRNGKLYTITGSKTYDLDNFPGGINNQYTYFFYINDTEGNLTASNQTDPWTLLDSRIPVAIVNWDATAYPTYWLTKETHQGLIDRRMHYVEHSTEGTKLIIAPTLADAVSNGTTNDDNTFSITASTIADEDLIHQISELTDPTGANGDGKYVIFYHSAANTWKWDTSDMPYKFTAGGYIEYDNGTGVIQGTQPRYYNSYLLITNKIGAARHAIVLGRNQYSTAAEAYGETPTSFDWTGFPIQESVICYQMTWQTSSSLGTKGKAKLARLPQRINSLISSSNSPISTIVTAAPITGNGSLASPVSIVQATPTSSGYLSNTDFNSFNDKVSSQWTTSGNNLYWNGTGAVGIGQTNPDGYKLYVKGKQYVYHESETSSFAMQVQNLSNSGTAIAGYAGGLNTTTGVKGTGYYGVKGESGVPGGYAGHFSNAQASGYGIYASANTASAIFMTGKVGVNTTAPISQLHINGSARISDTSIMLGKMYAFGLPFVSGSTRTLGIDTVTGQMVKIQNNPWEFSSTGIHYNDTISFGTGTIPVSMEFDGSMDEPMQIHFYTESRENESSIGIKGDGNHYLLMKSNNNISLEVDNIPAVQFLSTGISASIPINAFKGVEFPSTSVDSASSGNFISLTASTSMVVGDVIYVDANGKAARCNASAIANCPYALGISTKYAAANASGTFLTNGKLRKDTWSWTVGGLIYVATGGTRGSTLTQTAPSSSNNVIMPVAVALSSNTIYFFGNLNSVEKL